MGKLRIDQFADLAAAIVRAIPRNMDAATAKGWIDHPNSLSAALHRTLMPSVNDPEAAERNIIEDALRSCGQDEHKAANRLGIRVSLLRQQRKKYGL